LRVEDGLRQPEPLWLVTRRVREIVLGRRHDREAPEALVVVAFSEGLVSRHVVVGVADLEEEGLSDEIVV